MDSRVIYFFSLLSSHLWFSLIVPTSCWKWNEEGHRQHDHVFFFLKELVCPYIGLSYTGLSFKLDSWQDSQNNENEIILLTPRETSWILPYNSTQMTLNIWSGFRHYITTFQCWYCMGITKVQEFTRKCALLTVKCTLYFAFCVTLCLFGVLWFCLSYI